ncbi:MAG TPA: HtaA domain-containing protein [Iamia sp.]|nr:HtaA domain-containing protein [Iamia sp.]
MALLLAVTTALVGAPAAPSPAQEAPAPVAITVGDLEWGVRASFRSYVGEAGITTSAGVTRGDGGTFHWPIESGTYQAGTRTTTLQFGGTVRFYGHGGALDLSIARPRVEVGPDGGLLHADMSGLSHAGEPFDWPGAEVAILDVAAAEPVVTAATTTWAAVAASLSEAGVDAFADFYPLGAPLDPLTATYEGPGGKPELGETWSVPGIPHYAITGEGFTSPGASVVKVVEDTDGDVVHVPIDNTGYDPQANSFLPGALTAYDPTTMQQIDRLDLPFPLAQGGAWIDLDTHRTFLKPDRSRALWAVGWNPVTRSYGTPRHLGDLPSNAATGIWDSEADRLFLLDAGWYPTLHIVTVGATEALTVESVDLGLVYPRGEANLAIDDQGRFIMGSYGGNGLDDDQSDGVLVDASTSPVTIDRIAGSNHLERVGYANGNLVMSSLEGYARTFTWDEEAGAYVPTSARTETQIPSTALAIDPTTGVVVNLFGGSGGQLSVLIGGERTQAFDARGWTPNQILTTTPSGRIYANHYATDPSGRSVQRLLRIEAVGTTPSVTSQPTDETVVLDSPTGAGTGTFSVAVDGDPAPTVQWQSRPGPIGRFADVEGATGTTLEVPATAASSGTTYRAVVTNDVGAVATDEVALDVHTPPSVTQQPDDVTAVAGEDAVIKAMPAGNPYPEITWQRYAAGFWWNIGPDDDGFEIDGGFLTVTDTDVDQSGTRFRARLRNGVGTVHTRVVTLTVTEAADGPQHVVGGALDWGVRQSFRSYITGPIAHGSVAVTDGAAIDEDGTYSFPATGGTVEDDAVEAAFGGVVHFTGHVGMGTPPGVPALDMRVSDIRVDVDGQDGTLVADVVSRGLSSGSLVTYDDVVFATLDLSTVSPTPVAGGLRWANVPATLTEAGVPAFADFYPAGSALDPLTVTLALANEEPEPEPGRSAVESFATAALADFLGDEPTAEQVAAAVAAVETSGKTAFLRSLSTSDEWLAAVVDGLYADTLGRPAGANERAYWVGRLRAGWSVARVTASFYAAPEYHERVGGTDATWVADLYATLLGRTGGPREIGWWVGEVRAKGRGNVALRFFQTPESARTRVTGLYQDLLGRSPSAADVAYWGRVVVARGDLALAVQLAASPEYQARAVTRFP